MSQRFVKLGNSSNSTITKILNIKMCEMLLKQFLEKCSLTAYQEDKE